MAKTSKILALCALVSLAVAGCSNSSSDSNATPTPALTGTVRIGVEAPISGDQADTGKGMINGAQLAADQLNAKGGINGKKVVIVPIDDAADAVVGVKAATAAIKAGLDGVVGPYNSGAGAKTLPLYIKAGLTPIRLTSNSTTTDGLGYTLQPMDYQIVPVATEAVTKWLKAKTAVLVFDSTPGYTATTNAKLKASLEKAGVTVKANVGITPGAKSYAAQVKAAAALKPDVVYLVMYSPQAGLIAKTMYDTKVPAKCVADYAAADPIFVTTAGIPAAKACPVIGVPSPSEFPNGPDFVSQYKAAFGEEPGTWSPYTFDSLNLLAQAAEETGGFDAKKLKANLDAVKGWEGVTGSVTIDAANGNRDPATLVVLDVTDAGALAINKAWSKAVGADY